MNIGIIGAGWIADKMGETLSGVPADKGLVKYAIASRDIVKARGFAEHWGFKKAYGSYQELVDDPDVDLVYIATPHSHHYPHTKLALEAGKPVLCEKAFMANAREAEEILNLAHKKGIFITEAIWTRYMPLSLKVKELLDAGEIGDPRIVNASLCYYMDHKERILRPDLCGGALLDLGVYSINFARMYFGSDFASCVSSCTRFSTGTDRHNHIILTYKDGRVANLQASAGGLSNREGQIIGETGYIVVENINCPERVTVWHDYEKTAEFLPPADQVTGYEYQVFASKDAIEKGLIESPFMPHQETLDIMRQMDALRKEWGIRYPMD